MKRILFFAILFFPLLAFSQGRQDSVGVKTISSLTELTANVDTSYEVILHDPGTGKILYRASIGEFLKTIAAVSSVVGTSQIVNATIINEDISGSAAIALSKLENLTANRLVGRDTTGTGIPESLTVGYGFQMGTDRIDIDTVSATGLVSKSRLTNALDDVSGGGGGLTTVDTTESFATELVFYENREVGPYQVTGNVTFTVNDSAAVVGAFTTARMNFGADSLYSINFSGAEFDSVQQYNINSGDTLTGIHIVDFWYTRWGVAVNVPTNGAGFSNTVQDTVATTTNPFQQKSGLIVEFDGFYGRSTSSDTIIWASNEGSPANRAVSTDLTKKPSYSGTPGMTFSNNGAFLDLDTNFQPTSGNIAVTIAWNASGPTANNDFFGQNTDVASFDFHRNGSVSNTFNAFTGISITPGVLNTGPEIIQLSCSSGSCELWMDGVSKGTDSTGFVNTLITIIGALNKNSSTGVNGTIYHIAVHDSAYAGTERSDMFDYVNDRYSMGL